MSGDAALRATVHGHWGDRSPTAARSAAPIGRRSAAARAAGAAAGAVLRAGAGQEARCRVGQRTGFQERLASAWQGFIERSPIRRRPGCASSPASGREAVQATYAALLDGRVARVRRPGAGAVSAVTVRSAAPTRAGPPARRPGRLDRPLPPRRDSGPARNRRRARGVARERGAHRREQHRRDDRRRSADDAEGARVRVGPSRPQRRHAAPRPSSRRW